MSEKKTASLMTPEERTMSYVMEHIPFDAPPEFGELIRSYEKFMALCTTSGRITTSRVIRDYLSALRRRYPDFNTLPATEPDRVRALTCCLDMYPSLNEKEPRSDLQLRIISLCNENRDRPLEEQMGVLVEALTSIASVNGNSDDKKSPDAMTAEQLADHLQVSLRYIRQKTKSGEIPHVKLGRLVRYLRTKIVALMEKKCTTGRRGRPRKEPMEKSKP